METYFIYICIALVILILIYHSRCLKFVEKNSPLLKRLREINQEQDFVNFEIVESFQKKCNNKQQFDNFNEEKFALDIISKNTDKYFDCFENIEFNEVQYGLYKEQIQEILSDYYNYENVTRGHFISQSYFKILEKEQFERETIKPALTLSIELQVAYISPRGRNRYYKTYSFDLDKIKEFCDECIRIQEYRQSVKYKRSQITASVRYQIMKRDGFRCVLCNRGRNDGVVLHVDHKVPLAKGGTNDWSNLRTLCADCNLGKSDSYDPNGEN